MDFPILAARIIQQNLLYGLQTNSGVDQNGQQIQS